MSAHRYELWVHGDRIAKYKTKGQALLGALWRSKKLGVSVYVYTFGGSCVGRVAAGYV